MSGSEWLTYQEVAALWYHEPGAGQVVDVYPYNTIVLATVCFGYSGSDGISHMAKSFVDYGAAAFVGATTTIPANCNDGFTSDFWTMLCLFDQTVYISTVMYVNSHNSLLSTIRKTNPNEPTWIYGTHIKIYGNTGATLAN
jgi:hypothetical protein